jgi:hypothetical protein
VVVAGAVDVDVVELALVDAVLVTDVVALVAEVDCG